MQQPALAEAELQLHHELLQLTQTVREGADRLSKYDGTVPRSNAKQLEDQVQHYLRRLKSKLSDLQHAANEQETPEEVQRVAAVVQQHHEASEAARKAFQAARIQYDRNVQKHEEQQRRELIGAVDFSQRQQKFAKEQDVLEGSQDVTASLRRTRQLMMQNLEQTHGNISVLGASNAKIQGASDELAGQKNIFKETHKHQRTLQKQSWMDRWAMYIGFAFFLLCVGYISLRRTPAFIKQPVYALLHMKQGGQPFTHQDYASLNVPPGTFVPRKEQVFGTGQGKLPPEWEAWDENFAGVSGPADGSGAWQDAEWLDAEQHEPVGRAGGQVWRRGAHGELLEGREQQQQQQHGEHGSEAGSCTAPDEHSGHSECSAGHAAHHHQQQQSEESGGKRPVHGHEPELPPPPAPAPVPLNEAAPVDVTAGQHADPRARQQQQQQDSTWQQQQRAQGSSTQDQFDQGPEYFDEAGDDGPDSNQEPWGLDEDSLPIPAHPHPPGYHPHHGHPHHQQQRSPAPTAAGIIDPEAAEHAVGVTAHEHYGQQYGQHERYNGQQDRGGGHEGVEEDPDEMEYWRQQREAQQAAEMERMQQEQRAAAAAAAEAERARAAAAAALRQRMQQQRGHGVEHEREHEHDRRWERPQRPPLRQPEMEGGRPPIPPRHEQQQHEQQRWGGEGDDSHLEPRTPPQEPADLYDMHPEASQQQQQQREVHGDAQVEEPVAPQQQEQHVDGVHVEPEAQPHEEQQQQQQLEGHEQDTGPVRPPVQAPMQHHEAHNEHVDEQGHQQQEHQQQEHEAPAQPEHAAGQGHQEQQQQEQQEQQHEARAQPDAADAGQQPVGADEHGHDQAPAVDDLAAAVEAERLQQQQQQQQEAEAAAVRELQQRFEAGAPPQRPPVPAQPTAAVTPEQQQQQQQQQPGDHVAQQQHQQQQQHEEQPSEGAVGSPVLDVEHAAAEAADAAAETAAAAQRVVHDQAVATGYVAPDQGHDVADSGQQQDIHAEGGEGAHGGGAAGSDQQQQQPAHMAEQEAALKAQQEAAAAAAAAERAAQEKAAAAAAEEAARQEAAAAAEAEAQHQAAEEAARREAAAAAAAAAEREAQEKAAAAAAAEEAARREAAAAAEREAKRLAAEREMQERAAAAAAAEQAARQAAAAAAEREAAEKAAAEEAARREAAAAAEREARERAAAEAEAQRQAAAAAAEEAAQREAAAAAEREAQEKAAAAAAAEEAAQREAAAAAAAEAEAQRQAAAAAAEQKAATATEVFAFDTAAGPDAAALIWQVKQDEVAAKMAQQAQQGHNTATPAAPPFAPVVEADQEEDEQSEGVVSGGGLVGLWSSFKDKISLGPRMVAAQEHASYDEEPPLPFKLELRPLEGAEHFFDEPYGDYYFNSDGSWDSREGSVEGEESGGKGVGGGKGGKGVHHGKGGSGGGGGKQHVRPGVGAKAQDVAAASAAHEYQAYGDYPEDSVDEMDYDAAAELSLLGEDGVWGDEGRSVQQGGAGGAARQQQQQQQRGAASAAQQQQQQQKQQAAGTAELR